MNFDLYFWSVAGKLTGSGAFQPVWEEAVAAEDYPKKNRHRRLLRARVENGKVTIPVKSHAASVLSNLLDCNCYIDLPAGTGIVAGETLRILRPVET